MAEETDKRRVSLPIWEDEYAWWTEAARAKLRPANPDGLDQKTLATKLGFSASEVSRAISREKPLYDIVIAISDELELPYPVLLPESEAEALYLATQRRLFRRDQQVEQIRAGVRKPRETSGAPPASRRRATRQRSR